VNELIKEYTSKRLNNNLPMSCINMAEGRWDMFSKMLHHRDLGIPGQVIWELRRLPDASLWQCFMLTPWFAHLDCH
jgi:hypothetical protein